MRKGSSAPPGLARRLMSLVLNRGEHYSLIGDFDEVYAETAAEKGRGYARVWYWGQIVRLIPARASQSWSRSLDMLKNYLITSLRNIKKQKGVTSINVLGLAIGMAACLLVMLYTGDEFSWDRYNVKADRICRIVTHVNRQGREMDFNGTGAPVAGALIREFPEVEDAVRFREAESMRVRFEDKLFRENRAIHADPSFFSVFSVPLLSGDPKTALAAPRTLALSRSTAAKYFGAADPVGRILQIDADGPVDYRVTGVFADIPRNSHFHFDFIIALATLEESRSSSWMTSDFPTYLLLKKGAPARALEEKLPSLMAARVNDELKITMGAALDDFTKKTGSTLEYRIQPLTRIHLHSAGGANGSEFEPGGDIGTVYLFVSVAVFILILAAANFVNLSTARSAGRAKEVGLRKVLGSGRGALVKQFLTETIVLSIIALVLAVLILIIVLPFFNALAGKDLHAGGLLQPRMAAAVIILTLAIGLLAGAYPAFFLSSFRPSPILAGALMSGLRSGRLRRVLVVFQFAVSIVLIVGTVVVFRQRQFIRTKNLGFDKDQVLVVSKAYLLAEHAEALKEEMLRFPAVAGAALSSFVPVPPSSTINTPVSRDGDPAPLKANPVNVWIVDPEFVDTLRMKIAAGRNFSWRLPTDSGAVLINQAAARYFGLDAPLGRRLNIARPDERSPDRALTSTPYTVIGVLEDFHFQSLRTPIAPLVVRLGRSHGNLILRIKPGGIAAALEALKSKWNAFLPGEPMEYSFLDERFAALYKSEMRVGRVFGVFAGLAVFIGCLGLFGMAAYAASKRAREVALHKVLGANAAEIVRLLIRESLLLVAAANLIAGPVAYGLMSKWLSRFAYRTGIGWAVFALTGGLTLVIAFLTVGFQSIKAATVDPASVLRYER